MDLNRFDTRQVTDVIRKHRKLIIGGAVALVAMTMLLVTIVGLAIYKTAAFAGAKLQNLDVTGVTEAAKDVATNVPAEATGFVEGFVLNLASGWLQQEVVQGEMAQVKHGLHCFDALGGPSPAAIVGFVKQSVTDPQLSTQLGRLHEDLSGYQSSTSGSAACASWLLNG